MSQSTLGPRGRSRRFSGAAWRSVLRIPGRQRADLERRIRRELRELDVQPPLDVPELCEALGRRRGKPIVLRPCPLPVPGPLGLWVSTPDADVVLYLESATRLHRDHIVLHEVGHILADHASPGSLEERWEALLPGIKASAVRRILQRCTYDDEQEYEAELVATIVMEWASVLDRVASATPADASVRRIQAALGDRRGWL